jgi:hypothetical protein
MSENDYFDYVDSKSEHIISYKRLRDKIYDLMQETSDLWEALVKFDAITRNINLDTIIEDIKHIKKINKFLFHIPEKKLHFRISARFEGDELIFSYDKIFHKNIRSIKNEIEEAFRKYVDHLIEYQFEQGKKRRWKFKNDSRFKESKEKRNKNS